MENFALQVYYSISYIHRFNKAYLIYLIYGIQDRHQKEMWYMRHADKIFTKTYRYLFSTTLKHSLNAGRQVGKQTSPIYVYSVLTNNCKALAARSEYHQKLILWFSLILICPWPASICLILHSVLQTPIFLDQIRALFRNCIYSTYDISTDM